MDEGLIRKNGPDQILEIDRKSGLTYVMNPGCCVTYIYCPIHSPEPENPVTGG
jgi:hypothetical protein